MGVVRNIMVRAVADFSSLQSASQDIQSNMNRMANNVSSSVNRMNRDSSKLGKVGEAFASLKRDLVLAAGTYLGIEGLKEATKAAYEYEAQMGNLTHILQDQTQSYVDWGNTQARMFGYGQSDAIKYGTQFANLVSTFTHGTEQIKSKTEQLMEVSAIIANGTGRSIDDVMERMRSGLLGNVQAINDLGIYANNSMIQTSKAFKQIADGRTWNALSFQEQQQIIYMSLMEQAATKYGNTMQQNTHLKVNQFIGILKDLRVELGNIVLPILNAVLPALNAMGMALLRVMKIVAQFSKALFGKAIWGDTAKTQNQTSAINNQSSSVDNLTKSVKKLSSAKKAAATSGGVAGFDQVNTLNSSSSSPDSSSDGGASGVSLGTPDNSGFNGAVNDSQDKVNKLSQAVQDFADKIKDWLKPLKPYWDDLTSAVSDLWTSIVNLWDSKGVQSFVSWLSDAAQWAIGASLETLANLIGDVSDAINVVADLLNGDWSKAWNDSKKLFSDLTSTFGGLSSVILGITSALIAQQIVSTVTKLWKDYKIATEETTAIQWLLNAAMDANPIGLIALAVGGLVTAGILLYQHWSDVTKLFSGIGKILSDATKSIGNIGSDIWKKVIGGWGDIKQWFTDNIIGGKSKGLMAALISLNPIGGMIYGYLTSNWGDIKKWFNDHIVTKIQTGIKDLSDIGKIIWGYLTSQWGNASSWVSSHIVGSYKKGGIKGAIGSLRNLGYTVWGYLTSGWGNITSWFSKYVTSPMKNALKGVTSGLGSTLESGFKSIFNKAADFLNKFISSFNKGKSKFPFGLGNVIPDIPTIPHLARGGITRSSTYAMIGDNPGGQEVVQPLSALQNYMGSTITNAIATAMKLSGGGHQQQSTKGNQNITLTIDGRTFARVIKPYMDIENKRVGTNVRLTTV